MRRGRTSSNLWLGYAQEHYLNNLFHLLERKGETHLDGSCVYIILTKLIETFQQLLNCLPNKKLTKFLIMRHAIKYETLHLWTKITQTILLFLHFNSLKKTNYIQSSILSLEILGKSCGYEKLYNVLHSSVFRGLTASFCSIQWSLGSLD